MQERRGADLTNHIHGYYIWMGQFTTSAGQGHGPYVQLFLPRMSATSYAFSQRVEAPIPFERTLCLLRYRKSRRFGGLQRNIVVLLLQKEVPASISLCSRRRATAPFAMRNVDINSISRPDVPTGSCRQKGLTLIV